MRDPGIDAVAHMTGNILRANGYDVEPSDPLTWCGTCQEAARTSPWRHAWYRYNTSCEGWVAVQRSRASRSASMRRFGLEHLTEPYVELP